MFLSKLFSRRPSRRDGALPSICYSICQDAQTEAQSANTTTLCDDNGAFRQAWDSCVACIAANSDQDAIGGSNSTNSGGFSDPCASNDTSGGTIVTSHVTWIGSVTIAGALVPFTTMTADITVTAANSTSSGSTATLSTSLTSANSTASVSPTITSDSNLIPSAEPTASVNNDSGSKAWLAGAVVGPIAGVAIVAVGIFLWYRRRMASRKPQSEGMTDKPQLHSDCVPRPPPDELDAGMRHELPGDEWRDQKAVMSELPSKDPRLEDRTYGMSELP